MPQKVSLSGSVVTLAPLTMTFSALVCRIEHRDALMEVTRCECVYGVGGWVLRPGVRGMGRLRSRVKNRCLQLLNLAGCSVVAYRGVSIICFFQTFGIQQQLMN